MTIAFQIHTPSVYHSRLYPDITSAYVFVRYVNARQSQGEKVNVFYSTPSCYLKALHDSNTVWPTVEVRIVRSHTLSPILNTTQMPSGRPTR